MLPETKKHNVIVAIASRRRPSIDIKGTKLDQVVHGNDNACNVIMCNLISDT